MRQEPRGGGFALGVSHVEPWSEVRNRTAEVPEHGGDPLQGMLWVEAVREQLRVCHHEPVDRVPTGRPEDDSAASEIEQRDHVRIGDVWDQRQLAPRGPERPDRFSPPHILAFIGDHRVQSRILSVQLGEGAVKQANDPRPWEAAAQRVQGRREADRVAQCRCDRDQDAADILEAHPGEIARRSDIP